MAIQKQVVTIPFAQGLDQKTDPYQVAPGKFLSLVNKVFNKDKRLDKRNGFGLLGTRPPGSGLFPPAVYTTLTTFKNNLLAIGNYISPFSNAIKNFFQGAQFQTLSLSTLPLVRSSTNQSGADSAIAPNGFVCTVYTDNVPVSGSDVAQYKYVIADSVTGQIFNGPTQIFTAVAQPRVFVFGSYFLIFFGTSAKLLQYIAIPTATLTIPISPVTVSISYNSFLTGSFDGALGGNGNFYFSWNGNDAGGTIHTSYLMPGLSQGPTATTGSLATDIISVAIDNTTPSQPVIWTSFFNGSSVYAFAVSYQLAPILTPTAVDTGINVTNITAFAENGILTAFYEVVNAYTYDGSILTDFIKTNTCTQTGTIGTASVFIRSVGLASKVFFASGNYFFLAAYDSPYQPTYFLINSNAQPIAKIAYSNGGGYSSGGLPSVTVIGNVASMAYLYADLVQAAQKSMNPIGQPTPVYSQDGVNLVQFTIGNIPIVSSEIGNDLHLPGGFLWLYDGTRPSEHGFFVWPDSVEIDGSIIAGSLIPQEYFYQCTYEWTDSQGNVHRSAPSIPVSFTIFTPPASFTGGRTSGSATIIAVSSFANLQPGQQVGATGFPLGTFIVSLNPTAATMVLSNPATSGSATSTTFVPNAVTALTINVPTLRITYKTAPLTSVRIVIYRWSADQPIFYQTTSIETPFLNNMAVDSLAWTDELSDAQIDGNNILYTTGGVIENIGAPATNSVTLWKARLWLIDAEDPDLLWYSKPVVESSPVEFSDLFTFYVPPTVGAETGTGPNTCLFSMDANLIIWKLNAIYYLFGDGPDITGANNDYTQPNFITSTLGCTNQQSIVFTPNGLMFQASLGRGIWLLGRDLSTSYIGAPVENFNGFTVLSSVQVPGTTQVRFTMSNGQSVVYDYYFQQWGTFVGIPGISSTVYNALHTYIDKNGNLFQETPGLYQDNGSPVLVSWISGWFALTGLEGFQRAIYLYILGTYQSPHKMNIQIAYDYEQSPSQTVTITPQNYGSTWGSSTTWGADNAWGGLGNVEQWRINLTRQRCQAFQLSFQEIFDPTFGGVAGAGLTLSGINLVYGQKKGFYPLPASHVIS